MESRVTTYLETLLQAFSEMGYVIISKSVAGISIANSKSNVKKLDITDFSISDNVENVKSLANCLHAICKCEFAAQTRGTDVREIY